MKKVIKFAKKHDNILIFIVLLIIVAGNAYGYFLENNDELINFLNTYKMANGLTIYKDTNVIITPLFFYIGEILFNIFGKNFIVFKAYNLVSSTILYFLIYQILKELKVSKKLSIFYTLIIVAFSYIIIPAGANYNVVAYCIFEIGLLLAIKMKEGIKKDICQGLILFLVFLTNQKLGAGYFLATCIYNISNKNIKSLLKQLLTAGILLAVYLSYLYIQNNLYNFINYTILGIGEFKSNKSIDSNFIRIAIYFFISVVTTIIYMICIKKTKDTEKKNTFKLLISFAVGALMIVLPILNVYHLMLASILMLTSLMYLANQIIEQFISEKIVIRTVIALTLIFTCIMGARGIKQITLQSKLIQISPKNTPFCGAIIKKEIKEEMNKVIKYIQESEKDIIVLSTYAPFYSIELNDLNNNVYDWALKGNLGKDGENGLIERIKELQNTQILLYKSDEEESEIYQFANTAIQYIKENMEYVGKIENFDIYQTKK